MQTVKWIGFGFSNAVTKSVVHFFPSAGNVTAPYPAQCKLSVFGKGLQRKSVLIDGARFSQPDGVKLEAAFPFLQEGVSGPLGIEVEISASQPRLELWSSFCIIEFVSVAPSVKYFPRQVISEDGENSSAIPGLISRDAFMTASIIGVNAGKQPFQPNLSTGASLETLIPECAAENDFSDAYLKEIEPRECTWGLARAKGFEIRGTFPLDTAFFVLYRDTATRRPVSVCAL